MKERKFKRVLLGIAKSLGHGLTVIVFLLAFVGGAILHLGLPVSRTAAANILQHYLSQTLRGTIVIGEIDRLQGGGVAAIDLKVLDPDGRTVISVKRLEADIDPIDILQRVFGSYEKLSIEVKLVQARGADIQFLPTTERDEKGELLTHLSLQDAFTPEQTSGASTSSSNSRPIRVWFPRIVLRDVHAHGTISGSPEIEGKIDQALAKVLVTDKGVLVDVDKFGLRASGLGGIDTTAQGEVHIRVPGAIYGSVGGTIGEVPLQQDFRFESGYIHLKGNYPQILPSQMRPLLGTWPIDTPLAIQLEAEGKAPLLKVSAEVKALNQDNQTAFKLLANGEVDISLETPSKLHISSKELDLKQIKNELPTSNLDSETDVKVTIASGSPVVELSTNVSQGVVDNQKTPPLSIEAHYQKESWKADVRVEDPHFPALIHAEQNLEEEPLGPIEFEVQLTQSRLGKSEYLRPYLQGIDGAVSGVVQGSYNIESEALELNTDLVARQFVAESILVDSAELHSKLSGKASEPLSLSGESTLIATKLQVGDFEATRVDLTQRGSLGEPHLLLEGETSHDRKLRAEGQFNIQNASVDELVAQVSESNGSTNEDSSSTLAQPVHFEVAHASYKNNRLIVKDLYAHSLGEVRADIDYRPGALDLDLNASKLNISRISENLGFAAAELAGTLNAEISLHTSNNSQGKVHLEVKDGAVAGFRGMVIEADSQLEGQKLQGSGSVAISGLGKLSSTWNTQLSGSPLRGQSYREATGNLRVEMLDLDLATLALLLGISDELQLQGSATALIETERRPGRAPSLSATVKTKNLAATMSKNDVRIRGIDLDGAVQLAPDQSTATIALRLDDRNGLLASTSGSLELPLLNWISHAPSNEELMEAILQGKLNIVAVLPRRSILNWPNFIEAPLDGGITSARVAVTGNLRSPELAVVLKGEDLDAGNLGITRPVDVDANLRYVALTGALSGNMVIEDEGKPLGSVGLDINVPLTHLLKETPTGIPLWTGAIDLQLEAVPIELLAQASEMKLRGRAEGSLNIVRKAILPEIAAELRLSKVWADKYDIGDAVVELRTHGEDLVAHGQLTDEFGELTAALELGFTAVGTGVELTKGQPIFLDLRSDKYNVAAAAPFMSDFLDELSGSLAGRLRAELTPPEKDTDEWLASLEGEMNLSNGHLRPSGIGMNMTDTRLKIRAVPEGEFNVLRIENIAAKVDSTRDNLTGSALLRLKNLRPHSGHFDLKSKDMPVSIGANPLAKVTTEVRGELGLQDERLRLDININDLMAQLVETVDDQLIDISDNPSIEIVQAPRKEEVKAASSSIPILIKINLGQNVRIKNSLADVRLTGDPEIHIADEFTMGGTIQLARGGKAVVLGRTFIIDRGLIMFDTGDAADPHLQIGVAWTAPNNVIVRLDIGGTLSAPTLTWSSEPSLPGGEGDILALVIGGGGGNSADGSSAGGTSIAMVANEISQVEGLEFYATQEGNQSEGRVAGLNEASWSSYTASYQINDKLWFEGSYKRGNNGFQNAEKNGVSGTLDWRFHPQWSARTEIGTLGVGLDMLWQYRY